MLQRDWMDEAMTEKVTSIYLLDIRKVDRASIVRSQQRLISINSTRPLERYKALHSL